MPHLALVFLDLPHQLLQTLRHAVDTVRQLRHFVMGIRSRPGGKISLRDLPRHLRQFLNGLDNARHDHHSQHDHHHHQQCQQHPAEECESMHPIVKLLRQMLNALGLIINIRLNIVLHQLSHDINIVVEHLDIHIITVLSLQIRPDVIHPVLQRVNIAHQDLQPGPALTVRRDPHQLSELAAQILDHPVRILQPFFLPHRLKSDRSYHQLIEALVHLFLEIQVIVVGHRHVVHDRLVSIAVAVQRIDKIDYHDQKRNRHCR